MILFRCGYLVKTKRKMQIEHFFSPISGEDQKKRSSSRIEHFFPKFTLSCTPIQIIGGYATIGGIQPNYWGGISPHPPRVSAPLIADIVFYFEIQQRKLNFLFLSSIVLSNENKCHSCKTKPPIFFLFMIPNAGLHRLNRCKSCFSIGGNTIVTI